MVKLVPAGGLLLLGLVALALSSCQGDGQFCVAGYTTQPNYDSGIRTVRVPIFKNLTMYKGLEFQVTQAVVREIQEKTPYRVVGLGADADTELLGTITGYNKTVINRNQLNEVREAETTMSVEVLWTDLRTGQVLSQAGPPGQVVPPPADLPPDATPPPVPVRPTLVLSLGRFIPELGGSLTTSQQENVNRLAVHVVSLMEAPW